MTKISDAFNTLSNALADVFETPSIQHSVVSALNLVVDTAIRVCTVMLIMSISLTVGPAVEARFFGVYQGWEATNFNRTPDGWSFDVTAFRPWYRTTCLFVEGQTPVVEIKNELGKPLEISAELEILNRRLNVGYAGSQKYSAKWRIKSDQPIQAGYIIEGRLKYNCHLLWASSTTFGPFTIITQ